MWTSSNAIPLLRKTPILIACCLLPFWCAPVLGQEHSPNSAVTEVVERDALKLLSDSDWAHTVKASLQDTPCTYQSPAFPGLYPSDLAVIRDEAAPVARLDPVKSDDSEYLIRFQSAKPVQTAVLDLLAMGEKWVTYGTSKIQVRTGPTDVANLHYNVADMITIAVILKRAGPDGTSIFNYACEGNVFPSRSFRVWPCAGLRTSTGMVHARVVPEVNGPDDESKVLQLSFPRLIDGKPLISGLHEKVEFRLIVNQRVFETTFYINASDVLDGSEKTLYLPSVFTDLKEIPQHQPIAESKL